jgi:hypothetical protein
MTAVALRERFRGALLGVAIGETPSVHLSKAAR